MDMLIVNKCIDFYIWNTSFQVVSQDKFVLACGILVTYPRSISIFTYKWGRKYLPPNVYTKCSKKQNTALIIDYPLLLYSGQVSSDSLFSMPRSFPDSKFWVPRIVIFQCQLVRGLDKFRLSEAGLGVKMIESGFFFQLSTITQVSSSIYEKIADHLRIPLRTDIGTCRAAIPARNAKYDNRLF